MKINLLRLDHVQVCIPYGSEEQAREFYGRLLGLEEIEKPDPLKANGGMWFQAADIQLHIGVENVGRNISKRHPAFDVADAKGVRAYLEQRGVPTREEPDIPGVVHRFSFFDPFGNRFELLEKTASA